MLFQTHRFIFIKQNVKRFRICNMRSCIKAREFQFLHFKKKEWLYLHVQMYMSMVYGKVNVTIICVDS